MKMKQTEHVYRTIEVTLLFVAALLLFAKAAGSAQELRAGYAKVDVTPAAPVYLGGYNLRDTPSDGIHSNDDLYARALVFDASSLRVAFVEADGIEIQGHDIFRRQISEATGIPGANILLGDAHNHSAPQPQAEAKTAWDRQFADGLVKAAREAVANLQPVRIAAGTGHSRIAMKRRQVRPAEVEGDNS
jgi:hypothetical protein